jgi:hypothetical protein
VDGYKRTLPVEPVKYRGIPFGDSVPLRVLRITPSIEDKKDDRPGHVFISPFAIWLSIYYPKELTSTCGVYLWRILATLAFPITKENFA